MNEEGMRSDERGNEKMVVFGGGQVSKLSESIECMDMGG